MPPARRAHPELIGRPGPVRGRVAHFHLGAAPHAADLKLAVSHAGDSISYQPSAISRQLSPEALAQTDAGLRRSLKAAG